MGSVGFSRTLVVEDGEDDGVDVDVDEKYLDEIETILTGTIEFRCFHFSTSNNHIDKLSFFMNRRARTPRLHPCSTLCA